MEGAGVSGSLQRAVFLDRDGTLIEDVDYLTRVEQLHILPRVPAALARLKAAGFLLVVASNQSAVARGRLDEDQIHLIHRELNTRLVSKGGAAIDAFYYCPHLPDGTVQRYSRACECRKPAPGMLRRAAAALGIDTSRSYMVGDSQRDVEAGRRAGCYSILLGLGPCEKADAVAADMAQAADLILDRVAYGL
jgi:D-glycero-D-manno-heptose 1,7-bisphosphate phosphatase